jgi:hypothetical protein
MNAIRLIVENKRLCFPHGGHDFDAEPAKFDDFDTPHLLLRRYDAGDCDTIPWPLSRGAAKRAKQLKNLAHALFDERECNAFFSSDAVIELPDGSVFDFDALVD